MIWFVESPWPILMLGLAIEVVLAIALWRTGRSNIVGAMVAVGMATLGLIVIERMIVTDVEQVEDTLSEAARSLEANDVAGLLATFADDSPKRNEVQTVLAHVTVREARIGGDLEIRVDTLAVPHSATARFTGRVNARDNRGSIPYEHFIRTFSVTLHRQDGHWRIYDYAEAEPRGGPAGAAGGRR
jgi:hypothetical protein